MRRIKMLVGFLGMLLVLTRDNTDVAKASETTYYRYDEVVTGTAESGQTTTKKVWFKNDVEISGNPGVMERDSQVMINVTPDEDCANYLASFDAPTVRVTVNSGVTVTFGSASSEASIQWLTCKNANVTVYAEAGEFDWNGTPSSVYGVSVYNSTVDFHGNIQYLYLGDEFPYSQGESAVNAGTVTVTGHVYTLGWYKTTETSKGTYRGFTGSVSVSGTVGTFTLMEMLYSNVLEAELKAETGNGSEIESFTMTGGVLSDATKSKVTSVTPDVENFYYELYPQNNGWRKVARYPSGAETNISETITEAEAKSLLSAGTSRVEVVVPGVSVDLSEYNLAELKLYRGTVTVGSVTNKGSGLLQIHSYGSDTIDAKVNGNVDKCSITLTRFNQNMSIDVDGTVTEGHIYKGSLQTDRSIDLGTFSCTDMWIMKKGIWNPLLFLSLGTAEYHPVDDSVLDSLLGLTKNITQGTETLSEMADMVVTEMTTDVLNGLTSNETFQSAVNKYEGVNVLTGIEIELSKFTYNETTSEVTNQEKITELADDKELSFTVKIPDGYKEGKQYIIVREHENAAGAKTMEVLKPTRDGNKLTFKTNKFSSFTIVETEEDELQETEGIGVVKSASLKIEDSIAIIYKGAVLKSALGEGEAPTARFTYRNAVTTASGTYLEDVVRPGDGKTYAVYQFECRNILPNYADENVKFELLLNGKVIACLEEYSVKKYCDSMLDKTAAELGISESKTAYFKTLLVNMLYYADAVKSHMNMAQTLTADLTETEKAYHTSGATDNAENKLALTGSQEDPYRFWSAALVLEERVKVQISFTAEDTENLSLKIQLGDSVTEYTAADFGSKDGRYIVKFDKINATQYDTPLTASFFKNGVQQTQVLTYSIGTYVNRSLASVQSDTLRNVLTEMYEFGQAAKNYVNAQ